MRLTFRSFFASIEPAMAVPELVLIRTFDLVRASRKMVLKCRACQASDNELIEETIAVIDESRDIISKTDKTISGYGPTRPGSLTWC